MAEFSLEGWTAAERESLSFLLDDAEITALWGPNEIEVPEESAQRVRRFVDFLNNKDDRSIEIEAATAASHDWDAIGAGSAFTGDAQFLDVATPGLRLGGALVDGLVFCATSICLYLAFGRGGAWVQFVLVAAYEIGMVGLLGRTLGNMAVHTRVVSLHDRGVPGLRAGLVRWLVPEAAFFLGLVTGWSGGVNLLWGLVVFAPILKGPSHRGLHDRASGVMVLDDRLAPVRPRPLPRTDVV